MYVNNYTCMTTKKYVIHACVRFTNGSPEFNAVYFEMRFNNALRAYSRSQHVDLIGPVFFIAYPLHVLKIAETLCHNT